MDQNEANERMTANQTPAGTPITTDTVFELYASLVPDSPWKARLLKIKEVFNLLATGSQMLTSIPGWNLGDLVYHVRENEGKGWEGPNVKQFSEGVAKLMAGLQAMHIAPATNAESPESKADQETSDDT